MFCQNPLDILVSLKKTQLISVFTLSCYGGLCIPALCLCLSLSLSLSVFISLSLSLYLSLSLCHSPFPPTNNMLG